MHYGLSANALALLGVLFMHMKANGFKSHSNKYLYVDDDDDDDEERKRDNLHLTLHCVNKIHWEVDA